MSDTSHLGSRLRGKDEGAGKDEGSVNDDRGARNDQRMRQFGKVDIPQEAFIAVLRMDGD